MERVVYLSQFFFKRVKGNIFQITLHTHTVYIIQRKGRKNKIQKSDKLDKSL